MDTFSSNNSQRYDPSYAEKFKTEQMRNVTKCSGGMQKQRGEYLSGSSGEKSNPCVLFEKSVRQYTQGNGLRTQSFSRKVLDSTHRTMGFARMKNQCISKGMQVSKTWRSVF
jgi:hypothetical protein